MALRMSHLLHFNRQKNVGQRLLAGLKSAQLLVNPIVVMQVNELGTYNEQQKNIRTMFSFSNISLQKYTSRSFRIFTSSFYFVVYMLGQSHLIYFCIQYVRVVNKSEIRVVALAPQADCRYGGVTSKLCSLLRLNHLKPC